MTEETRTPEEREAALLDEAEQDVFEAWLATGVAAGWVAHPDCSTHQGIPMRDWEETQFDDGSDPCIVVARIWRDGYQHVTAEDFE